MSAATRMLAPATVATGFWADMARAARIVLLNGPGSVGKSSVAATLQAIAPRPLLHLSMDRFCEMLPDRFQDHADTFLFDTRQVGGQTETGVVTGAKGRALLAAMRRSVAALADAGFDLVVDDVWLEGEPADYAGLLRGHRVWRVGLTAPLAVLEDRERDRDDRALGLARAQLPLVHRDVAYDLTIDTAGVTAEDVARRIAALAGLLAP